MVQRFSIGSRIELMSTSNTPLRFRTSAETAESLLEDDEDVDVSVLPIDAPMEPPLRFRSPTPILDTWPDREPAETADDEPVADLVDDKSVDDYLDEEESDGPDDGLSDVEGRAESGEGSTPAAAPKPPRDRRSRKERRGK